MTPPDVVIDGRLPAIAKAQPYPLLFATVGGAHLYGFPSPDYDWDLRGVHILPPSEVVGLKEGPHTRTVEEKRDGFELDLVTHDVRKSWACCCGGMATASNSCFRRSSW